jgi:hypothetical protein
VNVESNIQLDIKYPACTEYKVSHLRRTSGIRLLNWPDIRQARYPEKSVANSSASLVTTYLKIA